jgi:hypothetical protein
VCKRGVRQFAGGLQGKEIDTLPSEQWISHIECFGAHLSAGRLMHKPCPICSKPFPIIERPLQSENYNLPDAAVYQRLFSDSPCIALGTVTEKTTLGRKPTQSIRSRWQGMIWSIYQVIFLDVVNGIIGEFEPTTDWGLGQPPDRFDPMVTEIELASRNAYEHGTLPGRKLNGAGDSRATEELLERISSSILEKYGYSFVARDRRTGIIPAFWWGHWVDILYRKRETGDSLSIEVKVTEDWNHPINEPLAGLLRDSAVINVRVGNQGNRRSSAVQDLVSRAVGLLEETGRVRFLHVC